MLDTINEPPKNTPLKEMEEYLELIKHDVKYVLTLFSKRNLEQAYVRHLVNEAKDK